MTTAWWLGVAFMAGNLYQLDYQEMEFSCGRSMDGFMDVYGWINPRSLGFNLQVIYSLGWTLSCSADGDLEQNCKLGCGCQCLTIINKNTQVEYMQSEYIDMPILRFCWSISFYFICRPAHLNGRHFLDRSKTFVIDLETVHVHD